MINRDELKGKDLDTYQAFYCGICQDIRRQLGQLPRLTLNYDMTFLAILLTSLYGAPAEREKMRCLLHPVQKKICIRNKYTAYAADMCVLLTYHNLMDDWLDERKLKSVLFADGLRHSYKKAAQRWPRQTKAVMDYLRELHKVEDSGDLTIDLASGLTGKMFAEIFKIEDENPFNRDLAAMGFYIGKFIYLLDAFEDVKKDAETGNYNPFAEMAKQPDFEKRGIEILELMMSSAAVILERLPIIDQVDILKNIMYDGAWTKLRALKEKENAGSV